MFQNIIVWFLKTPNKKLKLLDNDCTIKVFFNKCYLDMPKNTATDSLQVSNFDILVNEMAFMPFVHIIISLVLKEENRHKWAVTRKMSCGGFALSTRKKSLKENYNNINDHLKI